MKILKSFNLFGMESTSKSEINYTATVIANAN